MPHPSIVGRVMEGTALSENRMWQDWVIMTGQWIMGVALIPAVFAKEKPPLKTSIPTAIFMMVFSFTFSTLGFWGSTASSFFGGVLWVILAVQKYRITRKQ